MKNFKKVIENFVCEYCKTNVKGNGYTNHCPNCLHSKHVDINPGDRNETCHGLMKPIYITVKKDGYIYRHKCIKCGHEKNQKSSPNDNFEAILKISTTKRP